MRFWLLSQLTAADPFKGFIICCSTETSFIDRSEGFSDQFLNVSVFGSNSNSHRTNWTHSNRTEINPDHQKTVSGFQAWTRVLQMKKSWDEPQSLTELLHGFWAERCSWFLLSVARQTSSGYQSEPSCFWTCVVNKGMKMFSCSTWSFKTWRGIKRKHGVMQRNGFIINHFTLKHQGKMIDDKSIIQ